MPHIIAEYSANLEDCLDVQGLVDDLHQAAIDSKVADLVGIRSRAARREHFRVADGNPANGFVHIIARLRIGRPEEVRTSARRSAARRRRQAAGQCLSDAIRSA